VADESHSDGLVEYRVTVPEDWIDNNNHLNDARYVTAFSTAIDTMLAQFGVRVPAPDGLSLVTAEMHVRFVREAKLGNWLLVLTRILDLDEKRLHTYQEMRDEQDGELLATAEWMTLHVDITVPRVVPFPGAVYAQLKALHARHARLPRPDDVGRSIGIRRDAGREVGTVSRGPMTERTSDS
jgi:acyl-CoA thioester hydrolase